jgi:Spy/CpxP family protein refolding chaperone
MKLTLIAGAMALIGAVAVAAPSYADDMKGDMKPAMKKEHHHHAKHVMKHGSMDVEAKERAVTAELNADQLHDGDKPHK